MHTEIYCKNLHELDRTEAIRAIHYALLQFRAMEKHRESSFVDNKPVMTELERLLKVVGYIGFTE